MGAGSLWPVPKVLTHEYLMWWEATLELLKDSCEEYGGRPAEEEPDLIPQSQRHTQRARSHFSTQNSIRSVRARRLLAHAWIMIILPSFCPPSHGRSQPSPTAVILSTFDIYDEDDAMGSVIFLCFIGIRAQKILIMR